MEKNVLWTSATPSLVPHFFVLRLLVSHMSPVLYPKVHKPEIRSNMVVTPRLIVDQSQLARSSANEYKFLLKTVGLIHLLYRTPVISYINN